MSGPPAGDLVVEHIGTLCTMVPTAHEVSRTPKLGLVPDAAVWCEGGRVRYAGPSSGLPAVPSITPRLDAKGGCVLPGLVDCHTHLLWAGSRADEFARRSMGATYAEIMAAGGGIRSTMRAVRAASEEELVGLCLRRLDEMLARGVTTVEAKSGYGLDLPSELKSLRGLRAANEQHPITVVPTCLAAHAIPPEHEGNPDRYVDVIVEEILPAVAEQGLAEAADVFVEKGAFTLEQGRKVLTRARDLGLTLHVHAEQLSRSGGAALAAELGALSAGHLEFATHDDVRALAEAGVVCEVLASAQVFLGMQERIPGKAMVEAGATIAVATDANPGSAHVLDLHLAAGLAITMAGLGAEDALVGVTAGGAAALGKPDRGRLAEGAVADLVVLDCQDPWPLVYEWGTNHVATVVKDGRIALSR